MLHAEEDPTQADRRPKGLAALFDVIADAQPGLCAIDVDGERITYAELAAGSRMPVARFGGQVLVLQTTYRPFFLAMLLTDASQRHPTRAFCIDPTQAEGRTMNQPYGAVDPETAAERAHVLLESEITARLDAVRDLAKRLNDLDAAIADYLSAWQSAARAGWTENTLADIGLRSPESLPSPSGRRTADTVAPAPSTPATASPTPAATPTLAPVVALTPPLVPSSSAATAPAFGPAPTLASVAPLSAPTSLTSPSVVSTPVN